MALLGKFGSEERDGMIHKLGAELRFCIQLYIVYKKGKNTVEESVVFFSLTNVFL